MNRRYFMTLLGGGMLIPQLALADHHVISAYPIEVEFDLSTLQAPYTPVEDFYVRNHFAAPSAVEGPTLRIEGEVESPVTLTAADCAKFTEKKFAAVLECAGNNVQSNGLVSNGAWSGWTLKDILSLVRPTSAAAHLHLIGRDGYQRSVPLDRAIADGYLVTHLNSRTLTRNHGTPWRALLPGWYGMDSVKWLERMVLAALQLPPEGGTYMSSRQLASGEIDRQPLPRMQVKSIIIDPTQGAVLKQGSLQVRGVAWTGTGKVDSVGVSVDGGKTWSAAALDPGQDLGWTIWTASFALAQPGAIEIVAKAQDSEGHEQPAQRDPSRLDGYTNNWYHRIRCVVV